MNLVTVVDVLDADGNFLWTARTRLELESRLGISLRSRNEDSLRWRVKDPAAIDSLCGLDEPWCGFLVNLRLVSRFEKLNGETQSNGE